MNLRRSPENLEQWLEIATRGLCDDAQERVRAEIESHFVDSLRQNLAQGLGDSDAYSVSMASLGDPRRARRAFRRTYLTKREATVLEGFRAPRSMLPAALNLVTVLIYALILRCHVAGLIWLTISWLLLYASGLWLQPYWVRRGRVRKALMFQMAIQVLSCPMLVWSYFVGFPQSASRYWPFFVVLLLLIFGPLWAANLSFQEKLRRLKSETGAHT